jgi:phosphohistidine swiveling domain-containing protein
VETGRIGGKAAGLALLSTAGLPVPPWCAVPVETVRAWLSQNDDALRAMLAPLLPLAIRSSSPLEDARHESRAGQFATRFVNSPGDCVAALRHVAGDPPIPVVLQRALTPVVSGVAFSANPQAARPRELLVEWVEGHGEQLVSGTRSPARFRHGPNGAAGDTGGLREEHLRALGQMVLRAEAAIGAAADVEWCIAGDTLWLLQARPVTALTLDSALLPPEPMSSWFFDQRFPHPVSPFTQSTLLPLIAEVSIGDALRMRGKSVPEPLVHFHAARPYVRLRDFDAILRGAPRWWLSPDLRQMFGPRGRASGGLFATLHYAACAALAVAVNAREVFWNIRAWDALKPPLAACAPEHVEDWQHFETAWRRMDSLTRRFLRIHRWSILWADYFYRASHLLPQPLRSRWNALMRHATALPTADANEAMARWQTSRTPGAREAVLLHYAHRSSSLDYAVPTWAEELGAHYAPPQPLPRRARMRLPWPLSVYARMLELREEQRFYWEYVLAAQRRMLLDMARVLVSRGLLACEQDVWLMRWDEVQHAALNGGSVSPAELAWRRHEQYLYDAMLPPALAGPELPASAPSRGTVLEGVAASPGVSRGAVVLSLHPARLQSLPPGSVLVAPALDPACSGIMRQAAGIIIERGGLLSHASILAREYGVPLVTGVEDATRRLCPGAMVEVDGNRGQVRLLD